VKYPWMAAEEEEEEEEEEQGELRKGYRAC
jgi:hypothetical protein